MDGKKNTQKNAEKFFCTFCDFKCSKKSDWDRHIIRPKHIKNENGNKNGNYKDKKTPNDNQCVYKCECGNIYKYQSGFSRHKREKNCKKNADYKENQKEEDFKTLTNLVLKVVKQNQELSSKIVEMCVNTSNNTLINNNSNNNNKTFNLNLFLNETCKDAMNISDFINSIKLNLEDLENTGKRGYIEGISDIILKNLNNLEQHMRPLHCSDLKREVLYIKDNDQWTKETENKPIFKKAIKTIANENIKQIKVWRDKNPDCTDPDSKKNNLYLQIVSNSMNGLTEEEGNKNINKIISNVAKEIIIDKN